MENEVCISSGIGQGMSKQEIPSPSASHCKVKEKIYCLSCSHSDVDFDKLKFHTFMQHPYGATVLVYSFGEADQNLYDHKFLCVKEACTFSTTFCSVYEEHLMSCCPSHETFSVDEKERLKSTLKFVLSFHNKHDLKAVPGLLDYISNLNQAFIRKNNNKERRHLDHPSSSILSDSVSICANQYSLKYGMTGKNSGDIYSFSPVPFPVLLLAAQSTGTIKVEQTDFNKAFPTFVGKQEHSNKRQVKSSTIGTNFNSPNEEETILAKADVLASENVKLEIGILENANDDTIDKISFSEETRRNTSVNEFKVHFVDPHDSGEDVSQQAKNDSRTSTSTQQIGHTVCQPNIDVQTIDLEYNIGPDLDGHLSARNVQMTSNAGEKSFICNECGYSFGQKDLLFHHMKTHIRGKPFKCSKCGKDFGQKCSLILHMQRHTGEKLYKCDKCDLSFSHMTSLAYHKHKQHGEEKFKCGVCNKTFALKSELVRHARRHTGDRMFECSKCNKSFYEAYCLKVHMRFHTGDRPFKCSDCGKSFTQEKTLARHRKLHREGGKAFICNECGKRFSQKGNLIEHIRIHTGEKPFRCIECGKTFGQSSNFRKHMRKHTEGKVIESDDYIREKIYRCNECDKSFHYKSKLNEHMRTHTGERPFQCDECGKNFCYSESLHRHVKTHIEEKAFKCSECGEAFGDNSTLFEHMKTHTEEKVFKCDDCDKSFRHSSKLVEHMKTHMENKMFKRHECGKIFSQSQVPHEHIETQTEEAFKCKECGKVLSHFQNLLFHMKTHTEEKTLKCNECGKSFCRNSKLTEHMVTHTGERPFQCNECGKCFGHSKSLLRHMKKHKEEKVKVHGL